MSGVPEVRGRVAEGSVKGTEKFIVETKYVCKAAAPSSFMSKIKMGTIQVKLVLHCVYV